LDREIAVTLDEILGSIHRSIIHTVLVQAPFSVRRLFRQDSIVGKLGRQAPHDQIICFAISRGNFFEFFVRVDLLFDQKGLW
jgi:hypothetical protein